MYGSLNWLQNDAFFFFFWNLDFSSFKVKELHCTSQGNSLVMIHRADLWIKITSFVKKLEGLTSFGSAGKNRYEWKPLNEPYEQEL